jgi:SAM-dependent methyltransferase
MGTQSAGNERRDSWSRYWAGGALHSCATSFAGNYDDAIGAFWRGVCAPLRGSERVLDVATGNGALPRLLIDTLAAEGRLPAIDAVDLAEIDPPWARQLAPSIAERVRFHPRAAAETLPFADACFDLVISQYGLEYSDLARSVGEVARVLKPGGVVALVLHHRESLPVRCGRFEVAHIDWLQASGGLIDRARRLLPYLARLATPAGMASVQRDPDAGKARIQLNEAMRALDTRAQMESVPDLLFEIQSQVGELLGNTAGIGERAARARLQAIVDGMVAARLRQAELVEHALDRAGVERVAAGLAQGAIAQAEISELCVRGELFGWSLRVGG